MPENDEVEQLLKRGMDALADWLKNTINLSTDVLKAALFNDEDNDWSFVIKLHSLLEAVLNHALISRLREPKLSDIITLLDIGDRKKGKMAFVKTLDIFPENQRKFIHMFSGLRNDLVHDVNNLDFKFSEWLSNKPSAERKVFREAISADAPEKVIYEGKLIPYSEWCMNHARIAILTQVIYVMLRLMVCDLKVRISMSNEEMARLVFEIKESANARLSKMNPVSNERNQSNPKE
jgi:hypothetical protein